MKFQIGVFAKLVDRYNEDTLRYEQVIEYYIHQWCNDTGIAYQKENNGGTFVTFHEFDFDEAQGVTREVIVAGMVEGLQAKKTNILADAQAQATAIDQKIGQLLQITYTAPVGDEGPLPWEIV